MTPPLKAIFLFCFPPVGLEPTPHPGQNMVAQRQRKRLPRAPCFALPPPRCIRHRRRSAPEQLTAAMRLLTMCHWLKSNEKTKEKDRLIRLFL